MGGVRINIGGSDAVSAKVDALNKKLDASEDKLKTIAKQSKLTEQDGKRLWEKTRTPLERYNRSLDKAKQLLKQGAISQNTYGRAADSARKKLDDQSRSAVGLGSTFRSLAGGYLSAAGAVGILAAAFRGLSAAQQEGAAKVQGNVPGIAKLAQLAGGDPDKFRKLRGEARQAFRRGAGETEGEAAGLVFQLRSAGAGGELPFFTDLARSRAFGNVQDLSRASAALRKSFTGGQAGTFQNVVSAGLGASGFNPQDVSQLLTATARAGGSAQALGVSPEALLAATAISGSAAGTSEQGATRVAAFLRQIERAPQGGFKGLGLEGIVGRIQTLQGQGAGIQDILGSRAEAIQGFRDISGNLPEFQAAREAARRARAENLAIATAQIAQTDSQVSQAIRTRTARAQAEVAREAFALEGLRQQERQARMGQISAALGANPIEQGAIDIAFEPRVQSFVGGLVSAGTAPFRKMESLLERIADNSDRTSASAPLQTPEP